MNAAIIRDLIFWCGLGHFALCLASLLVPRALDWHQHLKSLRPLLRQMFWTYAAYILAVNAGFGFISVFGNHEMLNGSFLAKSLTLFIGLYWLARVAIQCFYFDRSEAPAGLIYVIGEVALVGLFILFAICYLVAFVFNLAWI